MLFTLESQTPSTEFLARLKPSQSHEYQMAEMPPLWWAPLKGSSLSLKIFKLLMGWFLIYMLSSHIPAPPKGEDFGIFKELSLTFYNLIVLQ